MSDSVQASCDNDAAKRQMCENQLKIKLLSTVPASKVLNGLSFKKLFPYSVSRCNYSPQL